MSTTNHSTWKKPPVKEVVLDIRFSPVKDYAIFVGGMAERMKDKFPDVIPLGNSLPESIIISGQLKHRFLDEKKTFSFQAGSDIVTFNSLQYTGFNEFRERIQELLHYTITYLKNNKIGKISLKYINYFLDVKNPFEILKIEPTFPDFDIQKNQRIMLGYQKKDSEKIYIAKNIIYPYRANSQDLLFSLEAFSENENTNHLNFDLESDSSIMSWVKDAHDLIWIDFDLLITDEEKKKRK